MVHGLGGVGVGSQGVCVQCVRLWGYYSHLVLRALLLHPFLLAEWWGWPMAPSHRSHPTARALQPKFGVGPSPRLTFSHREGIALKTTCVCVCVWVLSD